MRESHGISCEPPFSIPPPLDDSRELTGSSLALARPIFKTLVLIARRGDNMRLNLPLMSRNPFDARPLESEDHSLLIGREALLSRWTSFLTAGTPRLVALVGSRGSGRTSLLQVLASEAGSAYHMSMYPEEGTVHAVMEQTYYALIDYNPPPTMQLMAERLVSGLRGRGTPLSLIAYDFPEATSEEMLHLVVRLSSVAQRFDALVVFTFTDAQFSLLTEEDRTRFDHVEHLDPLDDASLSLMLRRRVESVSKLGWLPPDDLVRAMMDLTGGVPAAVMRQMRDLVDDERLNPSNVVRRIDADRPPVMLERESAIQTSSGPAWDPEVDSAPPASDELDDTGHAQSALAGPLCELDLSPKVGPPMHEHGVLDEFNGTSPPPPSGGAFGGLIHRNRNAPSKEEAPIITTSEHVEGEGGELWFEEGFAPIDDRDQVAIVADPSSVDMGSDLIGTPPEQEHAPAPTHSAPSPAPSDDLALDLLTHLLSRIRGMEDGPSEEVIGLASKLDHLRRRAAYGSPEHPFDPGILVRLTTKEGILLERLAEAPRSPSDQDLLIELSVGRSRMSQMCNRLHRSGLVERLRDGRHHVYRLTDEARTYLVRNGLLEVMG